MKKVLSALSIVALVATSSVYNVSAANISDLVVNNATSIASSTQVTTIKFTAPANVGTVVVGYPSTIDDTGLVNGDVAVNNAATDIGATSIAVDTTANTITFVGDGTSTSDIVTITLSNSHFATPAGNSLVTFSVSAGNNQGASVINVGNGTANQVTVSARVLPTLSLALANGTDGNQTIAFGNLTPGSFSEDDLGLTYATNAVNGVTITMTSGGLKDTNINREIGVQSIDAATDTTATDYYKVSTAGAVAAVTFDTTDNAIDNAGGRDMRNTQTLLTTSAPNASATQMISVGVQAAVNTEAGNYSDTLTFTVAGSF